MQSKWKMCSGHPEKLQCSCADCVATFKTEYLNFCSFVYLFLGIVWPFRKYFTLFHSTFQHAQKFENNANVNSS